MTGPRRYVFSARAGREMRRVPTEMQRRILASLARLVADPVSAEVRKLQGFEDEWRLRVGDWRVRFKYDDDGATVVVTRVLPHGRAYRG